MTDNEIIQALKLCGCTPDCSWCPYYDPNKEHNEKCYDRRNEDFDSLITRQKAEIEAQCKAVNINQAEATEIKSEAIKEFAERLKVILAGYECCFIENQDWSARNTIQQVLAELDNLVKEMVGEG